MPSELTPITSTTYGSRAGIDGIYGTTNVAAWADLNNNQSAAEIVAQIDRARFFAYETINSYLRGARLTAPATSADFTEFALLDDIENELAGAWLYSHRGIADIVSEQQTETLAGQMQGHWDHAIRELERIIGIVVAAGEDTEIVGEFGFVNIARRVCAQEGDENWRPTGFE